jgi:hypothetical protein
MGCSALSGPQTSLEEDLPLWPPALQHFFDILVMKTISTEQRLDWIHLDLFNEFLSDARPIEGACI